MRLYGQMVVSALAVVTIAGLGAAANGLFTADAPGWFTETSVERANQQPVQDNRPVLDRRTSPQPSAGPDRPTGRPVTPKPSASARMSTPEPDGVDHGTATATPEADNRGRATPTPGVEHSGRATPTPTPDADHGPGPGSGTGGGGSGGGGSKGSGGNTPGR